MCDSLFCSLDIARKLLEAETFSTGTVVEKSCVSHNTSNGIECQWLYSQNTPDIPIKTQLKFYQDVIDQMSAAHRAGRPRGLRPQLEVIPGILQNVN